MNVARNVMTEPLLVPGGGAAEMALAQVGMDLFCCSEHSSSWSDKNSPT